MNKKGQTAIEFIFIILIIVVYIFTVTMPFIEQSQGVVNDIEDVAKANAETNKIAQAANRVALLGDGSKETVYLFLSSDTNINCYKNTSRIGFSVKINKANNPEIFSCPNNVCTKDIYLNSNVNLDCAAGETIAAGTHKLVIKNDPSSDKTIIGQ